MPICKVPAPIQQMFGDDMIWLALTKFGAACHRIAFRSTRLPPRSLPAGTAVTQLCAAVRRRGNSRWGSIGACEGPQAALVSVVCLGNSPSTRVPLRSHCLFIQHAVSAAPTAPTALSAVLLTAWLLLAQPDLHQPPLFCGRGLGD